MVGQFWNSLNCWVAKTMIGLMVFRYNSLPMRLLKPEISSKGWLSYWWSFREGPKVVPVGFDLRNPNDSRRSSKYFLWEMKVPALECVTFNPIKYLRMPRSLIFKLLSRMFLILLNSIREVSAIMISSTYTKRVVKLPSCISVNKE